MIAIFALLGLAGTYACADSEEFGDESSSASGSIISKYLQATRGASANSSAMEVDIDASVPRLNQHGHLKALRKISTIGKITYRVMGFQGDNSVKSEIIGRYLQAEQQGQSNQSLQVIPTNYKFKFKGEKVDDSGNDRYVFQLSPRIKRVGLFKGELWLDAHTFLPVVEKGRLVKNPSVFFRKVDFEREFWIKNGAAVPAHMNSTIDTRLVGKVNLSIHYSSVAPDSTQDSDIAESAIQSSANDLP